MPKNIIRKRLHKEKDRNLIKALKIKTINNKKYYNVIPSITPNAFELQNGRIQNAEIKFLTKNSNSTIKFTISINNSCGNIYIDNENSTIKTFNCESNQNGLVIQTFNFLFQNNINGICNFHVTFTCAPDNEYILNCSIQP